MEAKINQKYKIAMIIFCLMTTLTSIASVCWYGTHNAEKALFMWFLSMGCLFVSFWLDADWYGKYRKTTGHAAIPVKSDDGDTVKFLDKTVSITGVIWTVALGVLIIEALILK